MKIKIVFTSAILAAFMFSCGTDKKSDAVAVDSLGTEASYTADTAASTIIWEGNMVGVYKHSGTLNLTEGSFTVKGLQVTGGSFTATLKSINPTDSNYSAEHPKSGLVGHLSSAEFFAVDSFPTTTFVIKSVSGNTATGDLTLRGKTNEETVTNITVDTVGGIKASGKLVFDRQKYNVAYKAAGDKVLSNDITLDITLVAKK
jgi:polyisoprenoid-binding protein YceI